MPNSVEKYDPQFKDNVKTNINGMYGNISNTYTLVPQFKGKYTISSADFVYFDPKKEKYINISPGDLMINVLEGPSSSSSLKMSDNKNLNNIIFSENQFKFLITKPDLFPISKFTNIFECSFQEAVFFYCKTSNNFSEFINITSITF